MTINGQEMVPRVDENILQLEDGWKLCKSTQV